MSSAPLGSRRWVAPIALTFLILAVAPAIGQVRDLLFEAFPEGSLRFLTLAFGVAAAGAGVYALVRLYSSRRHRRWRFAGLASVAVLLYLQVVGFSTGLPRVDVVEKAHIVEYGLLALLLYRALRRSPADPDEQPGAEADDPALFLLAASGVALAGTADEAVQWIAPQRTGEIRDVLLNLSAGLTGLLFAAAIDPPLRFSWRLAPRRRRLAARLAAVTILAIGLFIDLAHLGHEIFDAEIGHFRSRFTATELAELAARRQEEWAAHPPTDLEVWGVEDVFLTEAAWHANHRNASLDGDLYTLAWSANRILEKYYGPFLDLESFRGSGRHRYRPELRRDLEAKKGNLDPASYWSPVLRSRIFPWPRFPFLVGLFLLAGAIWTSPFWLGFGRRPAELEPGRGEIQASGNGTGR